MMSKPEKQHEWLMQLVGSWEYETRCSAGEGKPEIVMKGRETVRSLGGLWVVGEGESQMPPGEDGKPGGDAKMLLTIGYDPSAKNGQGGYVGTWIGSMMARLWIYDGTLEGNKLILASQGPSFTDPGKLANYHDIITVIGPNERHFSSECQGDDGKWTQFMHAVYRRV